MSATDRGMALGLRALGRLAGLDVVDRLGARHASERALYRASRDGFRIAGGTARTFAAVSRGGRPVRLEAARSPGLFDLTPTPEQQMLQEACREFGEDVLRSAAHAAERAYGPPAEVLEQAGELGLTVLGVSDAVGGAVEKRSAVTAVLVAEALAHGDMGLALAALAPAGVATALALWGDADQQATYLPALAGDEPPPAAIALLEARPLFDPLAPATSARHTARGYALTGTKTLVPLAEIAELLVVGAEVAGEGPRLFVVEVAGNGVLVKADRAMGLASAGLGTVRLDEADGMRLGDATAYAEAVRRARLAWCALVVGTARAVLDYVIPYVNDRIAFGEPISHRQAVAFGISDIAIEVEGMRLATLRAAARADAGQDFARETAIATQLCARHGPAIGSQGVQLLGGHGYVKEHPVERWYRDLRAAGVMEGAVLV